MSRIVRALLGLVATVALVVAPAGAATAVAAADEVACEVTFTPSAHTGGFTALIIIKNTGTLGIYGWTLAFPADEGVVIIDMWNAELLSRSALVTATNEPWNGDVGPGESVVLNLLASGDAAGVQQEFSINGVTCANGE